MACSAARTEVPRASNVPANETRTLADLEIHRDASDAQGAPDVRSVDATAALDAADGSEQTPLETIADEPPYLPGRRPRSPGEVSASSEDETIARWNRGGNDDAFHPAPRIRVDVVKAQGAREADVLKLARSKGYWPVRLCYERGLRKRQRLHGTVTLALVVGQAGAVKQARKLSSDVDDVPVVKCIASSFRKLLLSSPTRKTAKVTLLVSMWPGDEPVYAPDPQETQGHTSQPVPADLAGALRELWPQVRACYRDGLLRDRALWGRIALRLRIAPAGEVLEVSQVESRLRDQGVAECVFRAFLTASLPPSPKGITVIYPLRLGSPPDQPAP
jgi:hypothetical protein